MTDKEIIALIESKLPQELTLEEIETIQHRLKQSAALRTALHAQLQMDEYLSGLIGPIDLSPETVFAAAHGAKHRASLWSWFGWGVCLLLILFVGGMLTSPLWWKPADNRGDLANVKNPADKNADNDDSDDTDANAKPADANAPAQTAIAAAGNGANAPGGHEVAVGVNGQPVASQPNAAPGALRIEIPAAKFSSAENVIVDNDKFGKGIGVLVSTETHCWAEYEFIAPVASQYRMILKYAAAEPRPFRVLVNGVKVRQRVATGATGNEYPEGQREFVVGVFRLVKGPNRVRMQSTAHFPHVSKLIFEQIGGQVSPVAAVGPPPWLTDTQLGAPPHSMDDIAADTFDADDAPSPADIHQWFTRERGGNTGHGDFYGKKLAVLEGKLRLNAPLSEDSVLRVSLYDAQSIGFHFWRGDRGLSLRCQAEKGCLAAYALNRHGDIEHPQRALAATDDDRNWRMNPSLQPLRLDIRFHKGMFAVSRDGIELLRAPFEGQPDEVYFEGHSIVRGLAMVRTTSDLPPEPAERPIAADIARPADLKWTTNLPSGMTLDKAADGSVCLRSNNSEQSGWAACPLPDGGLGLHELVVELDELTPQTHVGLGGGEKGEPRATIGFFNDNNGPGHLSFRWGWYPEENRDHAIDPNNGHVAASIWPHAWLKFIGGCGLKCYTSLDGVHWARLLMPPENVNGPLTHLVIWTPKSNQPRNIKVRRVTLRKLPAAESLAPAELLAQAPALPVNDINSWDAEMTKRQPPGVTREAWRCACALKALAVGGQTNNLRPLVERLADHVVSSAAPADEQIRQLDELALLNNVYDWGQAPHASHFMHYYFEVGLRLARNGDPHPFTTIAPAMVRSPLWCVTQYGQSSMNRNLVSLESLPALELAQDVYSGSIPEVRRLLARMHVWNVQDPLVGWASSWLARQSDADAPGERLAQHARQHPLVEELNKEGFNLLGDFQAALDSKAYHDACQIIVNSESTDSLGLWPDAHDPALLVSVNGAIDFALAANPELRRTMLREFGPIGMLQARQAIDQADSAAVLAVLSHYRGTEAAATACLWLGDRAMSIGDFAKAHDYYSQAKAVATPALADGIAARDRLSGAMLGQNVGQPVHGPVRLGDVQVSGDDFEKLVSEMRVAHAISGGAMQAASQEDAVAPRPSGFDLREIGRLDGDLGDNPNDYGGVSPPRDGRNYFMVGDVNRNRFLTADVPWQPVYRNIDWAGRQIATASDGDRLYVSNRFEVAAFDLKKPERKWVTGVGGEHAKTHDWTLTPMRPLIVGSRVFCRRLVRNPALQQNPNGSGPELAALEKENGLVAWRTRPGLLVVSDPLWLGNSLVALTMIHADGQSVLYLSTFDARSGTVIAQARLATLRESWWQQRTCQLTMAGDGLAAVFGGTVVACDVSGKVRWVRRQEWVSPQDDPDWARQYQQPAVVAGNRLFIQQPGVLAIECVDLDSGVLIWRSVPAGLRRIVGLVNDKLIVETNSGFVAYSATKGTAVWYHDVGDLLEGQVCGGPGKFMYVRREKSPTGFVPVLVWVDPANGRELGTFTLSTLQHPSPMFGPFAAAGGKLYAFLAGGDNEPVRALCELQPKGTANMVGVAPDAGRIAHAR